MKVSAFFSKHSLCLKIPALFLSVLISLQPSGMGGTGHNPREIPNRALSTPQSHSSELNLSIPADWGTIEEYHRGSSGKTILYIQDAHSSLEAQENIAKMVAYLVRNYGVRTVFEEGYEGPVPTEDYFGFIQDQELKQKISYFFMDQLRLSGSEFAHIRRTQEFQLLGADNLRAHLENIQAYQESAKNQQAVVRDLEAMEKEIRKLIDQYFPEAVKRWMRLKERLDAGKIGLPQYLARTVGAIHELPLRNAKDVLFEMDRWESDFVHKALVGGDRDLKIFDYYKKLHLLKRLNAKTLTFEEYEVVGVGRFFSTEDFADFIFKETGKSLVLSKQWEKAIQNSIQFYELAKERDRAVEKAINNAVGADHRVRPVPESGQTQRSAPTILVFGGFHKSAITEMMKRNGYSYAVISPKISEPDRLHQDYYNRLMSAGYHPFEVPFLVSKATAPQRIFVTYTPSGIRRLVQAAAPFQNLPQEIFNRKLSQLRSETRQTEVGHKGGQAHKDALAILFDGILKRYLEDGAFEKTRSKVEARVRKRVERRFKKIRRLEIETKSDFWERKDFQGFVKGSAGEALREIFNRIAASAQHASLSKRFDRTLKNDPVKWKRIPWLLNDMTLNAGNSLSFPTAYFESSSASLLDSRRPLYADRVKELARLVTELNFFAETSALVLAIAEDLASGRDVPARQEMLRELDQLLAADAKRCQNPITRIAPSLIEFYFIASSFYVEHKADQNHMLTLWESRDQWPEEFQKELVAMEVISLVNHLELIWHLDLVHAGPVAIEGLAENEKRTGGENEMDFKYLAKGAEELFKRLEQKEDPILAKAAARFLLFASSVMSASEGGILAEHQKFLSGYFKSPRHYQTKYPRAIQRGLQFLVRSPQEFLDGSMGFYEIFDWMLAVHLIESLGKGESHLPYQPTIRDIVLYTERAKEWESSKDAQRRDLNHYPGEFSLSNQKKRFHIGRLEQFQKLAGHLEGHPEIANETDRQVMAVISRRSEMRSVTDAAEHLSLAAAVEFIRKTPPIERSNNVRHAMTFASAIEKYPIRKVLVVGLGAISLPFLLSLIGKEVVLVDMRAEDMNLDSFVAMMNRKLLEMGRRWQIKMPVIAEEFGQMDLLRNGLLPGSFDLVTMIDLVTDILFGDTREWLLNTKKLLKPEGGYVIADFDPAEAPNLGIRDYFDKIFPQSGWLENKKLFFGDYNSNEATSRFYRVEPNRSELRINEKLKTSLDELSASWQQVNRDQAVVVLNAHAFFALFDLLELSLKEPLGVSSAKIRQLVGELEIDPVYKHQMELFAEKILKIDMNRGLFIEDAREYFLRMNLSTVEASVKPLLRQLITKTEESGESLLFDIRGSKFGGDVRSALPHGLSFVESVSGLPSELDAVLNRLQVRILIPSALVKGSNFESESRDPNGFHDDIQFLFRNLARVVMKLSQTAKQHGGNDVLLRLGDFGVKGSVIKAGGGKGMLLQVRPHLDLKHDYFNFSTLTKSSILPAPHLFPLSKVFFDQTITSAPDAKFNNYLLLYGRDQPMVEVAARRIGNRIVLLVNPVVYGKPAYLTVLTVEEAVTNPKALDPDTWPKRLAVPEEFLKEPFGVTVFIKGADLLFENEELAKLVEGAASTEVVLGFLKRKIYDSLGRLPFETLVPSNSGTRYREALRHFYDQGYLTRNEIFLRRMIDDVLQEDHRKAGLLRLQEVVGYVANNLELPGPQLVPFVEVKLREAAEAMEKVKGVAISRKRANVDNRMLQVLRSNPSGLIDFLKKVSRSELRAERKNVKMNSEFTEKERERKRLKAEAERLQNVWTEERKKMNPVSQKKAEDARLTLKALRKRIPVEDQEKNSVASQLEANEDVPAVIYLDGGWLAKRSELRREAFAAIYRTQSMKQVKWFIFNAGQMPIEVYRELGLKNVRLVLGGMDEAYGQFGRNMKGKQIQLITEDYLRREPQYEDKIDRFLWEELPDIWAALLFAVSDEVFGVQKVNNAYRVVSEILREQLEEFQSTLVIRTNA